LPIYKSFADPLVMNYINYIYEFDMGFSFGNYEDSPHIHFVNTMLKRLGHFLIKRKQSNNFTINYVN